MVDIRRIDMGAPTFGPYSPGIKASNLIFVSGQVPDKGVRDIKAQTLNTLEKIKKILKAAGANVSNIVKISVYLRNKGDFKEMNDNPSSTTNPLSFSSTSSISAWLGITAAWMSQPWAENAAMNGPMKRAIPSSLRPQPKALSPIQIPL